MDLQIEGARQRLAQAIQAKWLARDHFDTLAMVAQSQLRRKSPTGVRHLALQDHAHLGAVARSD